MVSSDALARWRVPLGWILGLSALYLARPTLTLFVIGVALAAAGETLRLWAAGYVEKDKRLTMSGPYAWTRNPLYLGSLLVGLGFSLATGRLPFLAVFGLLFALVYVPVMKREALRLRNAFPEAYPSYAARVPLFVPRRPGLLSRPDEKPTFSWKRVQRNREHLTLAGVVVSASILGAKLVRAAGLL